MLNRDRLGGLDSLHHISRKLYISTPKIFNMILLILTRIMDYPTDYSLQFYALIKYFKIHVADQFFVNKN